MENNKVQPDNGGAGHGGQNGNSAVPTKSDVSPSSQQASAGETGTIKQSSVGSNTGVDLSGLKVLELDMHRQEAEKGSVIVKAPGYRKQMSVVAVHLVMMDIGVIYKVQLIVITPTDAYTMGIQGDVTLRIYFAPGGSVASVEVLNSDDPMLSEHAREYAYSVGGAENSTGTQQYADITIHYNL